MMYNFKIIISTLSYCTLREDMLQPKLTVLQPTTGRLHLVPTVICPLPFTAIYNHTARTRLNTKAYDRQISLEISKEKIAKTRHQKQVGTWNTQYIISFAMSYGIS